MSVDKYSKRLAALSKALSALADARSYCETTAQVDTIKKAITAVQEALSA